MSAPKPSIEELEKILKGEDEREVEILPGGEIVWVAESSKAADPVVALPFVSSSAVIDKIQHAQELIEGTVQVPPSGEDLGHAVSKLDEVIELLPAWLFAPPETQ